MKQIIAYALAGMLSFMSVACMKTTTTNPPTNSPNIGVVVALETAAASCTVSSALVSGPVAVWLAGPCATAMTGILSIVEANGTVAQIQATIATLQATAAELPPGTPYLNYANAAIALAQVALNTYITVTGQTATPTAAVARVEGVPTSRVIVWTGSERARIDAAKAKLAARK